MRFAGLALALLCSCTQLLGLDDVETSDRDLDADGVLDVEDNCKGTPNPEQADTDGDNLGDACDVLACEEPGRSTNRDVDRDGVDDGCDPCKLGFNDDEDGDGYFNACDRCPGFSDPLQDDADNDGIGDLCEVKQGLSSKQQRVFFDGFDQGDHDWIDPAWKLDNGLLAIVSAIDASVANTAVFGKAWQVEVAIDLPPIASANETFQISVRNAAGEILECAIDGDVSMVPAVYTLRGSFRGAAGSVYLSPGSTAVLRMYPQSLTQWSCEALKVGVVQTVGDATAPATVRIGATMPDARIRYIDVTR